MSAEPDAMAPPAIKVDAWRHLGELVADIMEELASDHSEREIERQKAVANWLPNNFATTYQAH